MNDIIIYSKENVYCPVAYSLKIIEGKWKLPILWVLSQNGTLRLSIEGLTNMMLTSSLKELEKDGLVNRVQYNEIPPHVDYSLAQNGKLLLPVLDELAKWGTELIQRKKE